MNANKAATALPAILLIGGIIVEIGLTGAFISYFLSQSGFGVKISAESLAAAEAGIQDALIKIVRNKNFSTDGNGYNLMVGSRSANVVVCKDVCAGEGKHKITSIGSAVSKRSKLEAVVNVNSVTGEVKLESISEVTL